ncbi:MAG: hypothetical protein MHM6MM_000256 [Cercozoa sp. M6MM]
MSLSVHVELDRPSKRFSPGEKISGHVVLRCQSKSETHGAVTVRFVGQVALQAPPRTRGGGSGLFDSPHASADVSTIVNRVCEASKGAKMAKEARFPFTFDVAADGDAVLVESYRGVCVLVDYCIEVDVKSGGIFGGNACGTRCKVFIAVPQPDAEDTWHEVPFELTPETVKNTRGVRQVPRFRVTGAFKCLSSEDGEDSLCDVGAPFAGHVTVVDVDREIRAVELQLVRVETVRVASGRQFKEATEVQNLQIVDGNVPLGLRVPIHMVFPRDFTCRSLAGKRFSVQFEVNLVVMLADDYVITENFPITLLRRRQHHRHF